MTTRLAREGSIATIPQRTVTNYTNNTKVVSPLSSLSSDLSVGVSLEKRGLLWQRKLSCDPNAVATQVSVFDDPETFDKYRPKPEWENIHRFDPEARWTWGEEKKIVRKIDIRIMIWACVMFMALEIDRANLAQALSDKFLQDLQLTTDDYNLGNSIFRLAFLCSELPSQLISKWVGPDRWIPCQIVLWSVVAFSQFWLTGRDSFLATRALLGLLQGGFIPDSILYLSYFYKHSELSIRMGYFYTAQAVADIFAALLAFGLLHMRGVAGVSGWRWMFLVEGLLTFVIGVFSFLLMPSGVCATTGWLRGKNGWFNEREETIMVNRVIREDPSKSDMHNREAITLKQLWKSLCDYDLWPIYILGLTFNIPMIPQMQYLVLTLMGPGMKFDTFTTNLLVIPFVVGHIITMIGLTYASELWNELTLTAMFGTVWALPLLIAMTVLDLAMLNRWVLYAILTVLLSYPSAHPIQVGWNSRNSNAVRSRTVSAACYNMFLQAGVIVASNIYRSDDAPLYKRGNKQLLAIACMNIVLYLLTKVYYVWRNKQRDRKWNTLSEAERLHYLATTTDEGNKRLDFRFEH